MQVTAPAFPESPGRSSDTSGPDGPGTLHYLQVRTRPQPDRRRGVAEIVQPERLHADGLAASDPPGPSASSSSPAAHRTRMRGEPRRENSALGLPIRRGDVAVGTVSDMANRHTALDVSFGALAHPARRHVIERLTSGPLTVGQATAALRIAKPTVSRHLGILEDAGLVVRRVRGRERELALVTPGLALPASWIDRQLSLWERMFDVVEAHLAEEDARE